MEAARRRAAAPPRSVKIPAARVRFMGSEALMY
jgi:hypothetical protein